MIRFYAPDIARTGVLPESESAHAVRVLRRRAGDPLEVVDGKGMLYRCILVGDSPRGATVEIEESVSLPKVWAPKIILAVAPTKHIDRMEWLIEKAVEIGVDEIVPLLCHRSERRELKVERLEKIAISAMKQSLKATLPAIAEMTPIDRFAGSFGDDVPARFVGYCDDSTNRQLLSQAYCAPENVVIAIGPEGDFSPDEIELLRLNKFSPVTMGDNRLRTETAALVALDTIHILNQLITN